MRFRTRYIGPSLDTASAISLGRKASMIRNRSRLALLNQLASHSFGATIDHYIGQFPLSDSTDGGSVLSIAGVGNNFIAPPYQPVYVFLGGMPVLAAAPTVFPEDYTYAEFQVPSLDDYYTFLGLTPPTLSTGETVDVFISIGNRYGYDCGDVPSGEIFQWIEP